MHWPNNKYAETDCHRTIGPPGSEMELIHKQFRAEQIMKTKPNQAANDIYIMNYGIQKLLEQLNPHKAAGPAGIKTTILKELAKEIAPILTIIFNISYDMMQHMIDQYHLPAYVANSWSISSLDI